MGRMHGETKVNTPSKNRRRSLSPSISPPVPQAHRWSPCSLHLRYYR
jgi:hypothetical protein